MSATGCPERAAVETPSGSVRSGRVVACRTRVVACRTRVVDCRPVEYLRVEIDGHILEVPTDDATLP